MPHKHNRIVFIVYSYEPVFPYHTAALTLKYSQSILHVLQSSLLVLIKLIELSFLIFQDGLEVWCQRLILVFSLVTSTVLINDISNLFLGFLLSYSNQRTPQQILRTAC